MSVHLYSSDGKSVEQKLIEQTEMTEEDDSHPKCVTTKESSGFNVYAAMNGYDFGTSNPMDRNGDPGVRNRIFLHDCVNRVEEVVNDVGDTNVQVSSGYYSFIGDIRKDMSCDSDFSTTAITSEEAYESEKSSSNDFSQSISAGAGIIS